MANGGVLVAALLALAVPAFRQPEAQEARTFTDGSRSMECPLYRPVIPLSGSVEMVEALRAAGGDVRLTVYPEVYAWLLRHRRSDAP